MRLHLVRHGRPLIDHGRPASQWELDPASEPAVRALAAHLPRAAAYFSSPEPKAGATARILAGDDFAMVPGLREQERGNAWVSDFSGTVRRAFERPDASVHEGWEPLALTQRRVSQAVRRILTEHAEQEIVLVGHGTAWTVLVSELTATEPNLDRWAGLAMPDVIHVEVS
ncbi:MAG: phosphoglycerate mutase family protein [Actinomycetota bacterium]|nr:phosphoglycerate mutase family protein [Actinomycetota bacterium]